MQGKPKSRAKNGRKLKRNAVASLLKQQCTKQCVLLYWLLYKTSKYAFKLLQTTGNSILRCLQAEADRGHDLAVQINNVVEQTEMYQQVNDDSILKVEEANMKLMTNIKRLQGAVNQNENRLKQIQNMIEADQKEGGAQQFFIF